MKQILIFMILIVSFTIAQKRTLLDVNNSSTDTLSSSATYTGEVTNALKNGNWSSIAVSAYANHSSGVDGTLTIRFGTDGSNWVRSETVTITSNTEHEAYVFPLTSRYYQVLFANGAELQTAFRLETILFEEDLSISQILRDSTISATISGATGNSTLGYAANTISTVEVLGGDITTKKITLTNYTNGSIIYVGSNNSVTSSNGLPLNYLDSYTLTVSNLNKVWLISSSSTDVRYNYEN